MKASRQKTGTVSWGEQLSTAVMRISPWPCSLMSTKCSMIKCSWTLNAWWRMTMSVILLESQTLCWSLQTSISSWRMRRKLPNSASTALTRTRGWLQPSKTKPGGREKINKQISSQTTRKWCSNGRIFKRSFTRSSLIESGRISIWSYSILRQEATSARKSRSTSNCFIYPKWLSSLTCLRRSLNL